MSQVLNYLADRQQEMVQMLKDLVSQESPSNDRQAVNRVGETMAHAFAALDAGVERIPQTTFGDFWRVTWGGRDGTGEAAEGAGRHPGRKILLLGHMDTVWPVGETTVRPFRVHEAESDGGPKATGPGVFDMKGGLVIGLYAVAALRGLELRPAHQLVFLFNSDEEVGSPSSRRLIEDEARRSEFVLVLEPSREEALVVGRKGVGRFELEVKGVAAHSGAAHERGVSAVEEMAHQILRLEGMTDYGLGTTVNVGVVRGGSKVNIRPAAAWASVDLRVASAEEGRRMSEAIRGLRPVNPKASLVVSGGMNRPPWATSAADEALFERARAVGEALGMELWPTGAGGGSDGNFTAALGVPTLDGLGVVGDDAHALSEWADLRSLPRRAALLAELVLELSR